MLALASPLWAEGEAAAPDRVLLTDGSSLMGTVEILADGKLVIHTDFAGKLEIPAEKVKSVQSGGRVNVALKTGDRLVGMMKQAADGSKSTVESGIGPVSVTPDQVTAIWPEGKPSPEELAAEKKIAEMKPKWIAILEGGVTATEGNTDTLAGRAKGELRRTTAVDMLKFYTSVDYGEQNDDRNRNEYIAGVRYEASFEKIERLFWYLRGELEYDEFENLDLRATAAGGLGYAWIKKPTQDLKTSVGAGYRHQAFRNGDTTDDPILDLGLDYRVDIREWAQFTHSTVYSPSLEDFGDYRLVLDTALAFPIGKTENWKFKTGVKNEYNSDPQPGFDRLDNTYYANILVEFK